MATPNANPVPNGGNEENNRTVVVKEEQKPSPLAIRPIDFLSRANQFQLNYGDNPIGRKMLSDYGITSEINPKKMSVSRLQLMIRVKQTPYDGDTVEIEAMGVNACTVIIGGFSRSLDKGNKLILKIGNRFTLCGPHFQFQLEPWGTPLQNFPSAKQSVETVSNQIRLQYRPPPKKVKYEGPRPQKAASIGKRVQAVWQRMDGRRYVGTITNYSESMNQYEVRYDDGRLMWELEHYLVMLEPEMEIKRKQQRTSGQPRKRMTLESEEDEVEEEGGYGSTGGQQESRRSSARSKKRVNYIYDWPSSDSSDSSSGMELTAKSTGISDQPRKTNYTVLRAQLHSKPTAVLYSPVCLKHYVPNWHLERPSRLTQIMDGIKTIVRNFPDNLHIVEDQELVPRPLLLKVHDESYINRMESQVPTSDAPQHATQLTLDDRASEDCDTFMSQFSFEAAQSAAGAVCKAIDLVTAGTYRNAFCAIRPPGHHCGIKGHTATAASQGYCIINNVAVGAFHAMHNHGYKRVAVVDFDVHHGNGTEEILAGKEGFMFISVHVGEIYPGTGGDTQTRADNVINISLDPHSGSIEFRSAIEAKIVPSLEQFKPDLLLLSSGFDGHKRDPTDDGLELEVDDYAYVTAQMLDIGERFCGGKVVSVLEGGYNLPSLRKCVKEHVVGLMKRHKSSASNGTSKVEVSRTVTTTTTTQVTTKTTTKTATTLAAVIETETNIKPQVILSTPPPVLPTATGASVVGALRSGDVPSYSATTMLKSASTPGVAISPATPPSVSGSTTTTPPTTSGNTSAPVPV